DDSTVWSVVSGTLPPGLYYSGGRYGCSFYGIPNAGGTYSFTLRAVNSKNKYVERPFVIKINDEPYEAEDMSITGDFTTNKMVNENFGSYVNVNGCDGTVYWSVVGGSLPPGLSLSGQNWGCYLQGIPNKGGTYSFTLRATDSRNAYVERPFTVKINDAPYEGADMSVTGDFTTGVRVNESYYSSVSVGGYEGYVYWSLMSGSLPDGLSLRPSGSTVYLQGITNKGGTYTFILRATDSRNAYIERSFTVKINDTPYKDESMLISGSFDTGKNAGEEYYSYVSLGSYEGIPYWSLAGGTIPHGLSLRPSGSTAYIRGIPNTPGTYTFTLRATDYRNAYTEREFTITINGDAPSDPTSTTDMSLSGIFAEGYTVSTWYSSNVQVSGGTSD
ncbi:MAG: putative Ig domain-containing protein, partial [Synergistaceae bacterium]|nr:putative Ig domain-containing protein [Synergistaceae bacterium]